MTKEWQEAMNEKAKEDNLNPITGEISIFAKVAYEDDC